MKTTYKLVQKSFFNDDILSESIFESGVLLSKFLGVHRNTITNYFKRGSFAGKYSDYNRFIKIVKV